MFSFVDAQEIINLKLNDGRTVKGEFIGTYMEHVHLLDGEDLTHFDCNDIESATKLGDVNIFEYDCNKNTVTKEVLFPPQLNPMTGEWEVLIPDFLDPDKVRESTKKKEFLNSDFIGTQKTFKKATVNGKLLSQKQEQNARDSKTKGKNSYSYAGKDVDNLADKLTEQELRKIIKKEVRKELRRVLPYEIKKHKEAKQNNLFQNILLGCGGWFIFMLMLS